MGKKTTIEFSSRMSEVVQSLIDSEDARTVAEVVRNAIGLYYLAKNEQRAGNKLGVLDPIDNHLIKEIALSI